MISRVALWLSLGAIAAAVAGVVLLGNKLTRLSVRVAGLERRAQSPPPGPPPVPPPAAKEDARPDKETRQELERRKVREIVEKENQAHLDILAKKLALQPATEAKLRAAFSEEFAFYADGVVRSFNALQTEDPKPEDSWLSSPEFRKGLEERVAATDEKVRELLTAFQTAVFEQWRRDLRKDRYELD